MLTLKLAELCAVEWRGEQRRCLKLLDDGINLFPPHPFLFLVVNCYFISHASSTKRICKPAHSSTLTEPLFKALDIFHAVPRPLSRPPFIYHTIATPSPSPCTQRCTQHIYGHPITTYRHSSSCTLREGAARRCNVYRFFQHLCPACCNLIATDVMSADMKDPSHHCR